MHKVIEYKQNRYQKKKDDACGAKWWCMATFKKYDFSQIPMKVKKVLICERLTGISDCQTIVQKE